VAVELEVHASCIPGAACPARGATQGSRPLALFQRPRAGTASRCLPVAGCVRCRHGGPVRRGTQRAREVQSHKGCHEEGRPSAVIEFKFSVLRHQVILHRLRVNHGPTLPDAALLLGRTNPPPHLVRF
jgi:hypothetical protein